MDTLQHIRDLQFSDRLAAEYLLTQFLRDELMLSVVSVKLTPKPTSLNSFNGILTLENGGQKFFKTHTENDTVITEYYNARLLADAGYAIIQPIYQSTTAGKQFLLYEVIEEPAMFDVAWEIETGRSNRLDSIHRAQDIADKQLFTIYEKTLQMISIEQNRQAPIHQLFYHRLVAGRLNTFYDNQIVLPTGEHSCAAMRSWTWIINGQVYSDTLNAIITRATKLLSPDRETIAIVGHGDAHNGNVFIFEKAHEASLVYFDPAFAGLHNPLLDLVKPIFHNVFAMWMYFPQEKDSETHLEMLLDNAQVTVKYSYPLHEVRQIMLNSKLKNCLLPVLRSMKVQCVLDADWRAYLKAALFCCPFLTMNLADTARFSPKIAALGLAMAVEMGAESGTQRSFIDQCLDEVAAALDLEMS